MRFLPRNLESVSFKTPAPTAERRRELSLFQKHAGLRFKRLGLLDLAFCHRSYVNEIDEEIDNNERLEFLGDSVLGVVVADYLFRLLPHRPEGDLAKIKSYVVSEESLAPLARGIRIDNYIRIGRGEEFSGGRTKKALLADCFEAVIGAWYIDAGFDKAARFILRNLIPPIDTVLADKHRKDYKTILQEMVQKRFRSYPRYVLDKKTGPDHEKTFWMTVVVDDVVYGPGRGSNKKSAEQEAARLAYQALGASEKAESLDSAGNGGD